MGLEHLFYIGLVFSIGTFFGAFLSGLMKMVKRSDNHPVRMNRRSTDVEVFEHFNPVRRKMKNDFNGKRID